MVRPKLSFLRLVLLFAAAAAGGICSLDHFVFRPYVLRQKTDAIREQAARTEHSATWALGVEQKRLLGLARALVDGGGLGADLPAEAFARRLAALGEVDGAWLCDPAGDVRRVWWRGEGGASTADIRRALEGTEPHGEDAPSPAVPAACDSGLLRLGRGAVVFARCRLRRDEVASPPAPRLYLARRLGDRLLSRMGSAIPGPLALVGEDALPDQAITTFSPWLTWKVAKDRLAVAWPAKDCTGQSLGYFQAGLSVTNIEGQAATTRRTVLVVLSLSAAAVLLVIAGTRMFLVSPLSRLLRRLQRVEAGQGSAAELTDGLHGEPLLLARKLRSALAAMSELSKTDELTGLANRRQFDETLEHTYQQARRYNRPLSVMVMDIDLFKAVNDTKGHQAGDQVIREVGEVIRGSCRRADTPARLGGDEFGVLLPETTAGASAVVAERIRKGVQEHIVVVDGAEINVSLSLGVADLYAGKIERAADLVGLADEALYAAKQLGRNRFALAHEIEEEAWPDSMREGDRVELLRGKLAGLDSQFKGLFVRALQEIVQVMERRDPYMADHARKVQHYSALMARELNLSDELIKRIELAALLHDIGMLALPDSVALCPGRLSDEQFEAMKRHTVLGARILEGMEFVEQAIPVLRFHHERFDGKGYPEGLSGLGIPPICRIVAVADAFDAMTSSRAFRDGMPHEEGLEEIRKSAGAQFDPDMVEAFLAVAGRMGRRLSDVAAVRPPAKQDEPEGRPQDQVAPVR